MSDMAIEYERHRITVEEYHRMLDAEVFDPGRRIELVEGELLERVRPMNPPHASSVQRLNVLLVTTLGTKATVRCQLPVTLPPDSEPHPDFALARLDAHAYGDRHPNPDDLLLLIEVADSSRDLDRRQKIPLYARRGISEVWLVDLVDGVIVVHREPIGDWYGSIHTAKRGDFVSPLAFPDARFAVDDFAGPL